jgi:hypothetical protein
MPCAELASSRLAFTSPVLHKLLFRASCAFSATNIGILGFSPNHDKAVELFHQAWSSEITPRAAWLPLCSSRAPSRRASLEPQVRRPSNVQDTWSLACLYHHSDIFDSVRR